MKRESDILLWRRALGANLAIIPVLLGDVTRADLEAAGLAELLDYQCEQARDAGADLDRVADAIAERLANVPDGDRRDPMSQWIGRIAGCLRDVEDDVLRNSAEALGLPIHAVDLVVAQADGCHFYAHQMLERALEQPMIAAMGALKHRIAEERHRRLIAEIVSTWVDASAARQLLADHKPDERPVLLVNAMLDETARHYVQRATCRAPVGVRCEVVGAVPGEAALAEVIAAYEEGVRALLRLPTVFSLDSARPLDGLSFLIVNPGTVPMDLVIAAINDLRRRFPWLTVVLLTGPKLPDAATVTDAWRLEGPRPVLPALTEGDEQWASQLVGDLISLLPERMRSDLT